MISGNAHGEVLSIDDVANFLRRSLVGLTHLRIAFWASLLLGIILIIYAGQCIR